VCSTGYIRRGLIGLHSPNQPSTRPCSGTGPNLIAYAIDCSHLHRRQSATLFFKVMWPIISIIQVLALESRDWFPGLKGFGNSIVSGLGGNCRFRSNNGTLRVRGVLASESVLEYACISRKNHVVHSKGGSPQPALRYYLRWTPLAGAPRAEVVSRSARHIKSFQLSVVLIWRSWSHRTVPWCSAFGAAIQIASTGPADKYNGKSFLIR
jgi:hypothetical protein